MPDITILMQDHANHTAVPPHQFKVIRQPDLEIAGKAKNLFVFSSVTQLSTVSDFVHIANRRHQLRALFVREDIEPEWFPQMFSRANVRQLRNMLVHSTYDVPRRIISAWKIGAQDQLIANASIVNQHLLLLTCSLESLEVDIGNLQNVMGRRISDFSRFQVAADGSYLHWPDDDIHLDLDSFRYIADPEHKARVDEARLLADRRLGSAVASLRTSSGLKQTGINGLSERQVRRIEHGERPTVHSLRKIAEAHGMTFDDYLNQIAEVMRSNK